MLYFVVGRCYKYLQNIYFYNSFFSKKCVQGNELMSRDLTCTSWQVCAYFLVTNTNRIDFTSQCCSVLKTRVREHTIQNCVFMNTLLEKQYS